MTTDPKNELPEFCTCGDKILNAPGIGPFCPNKECPIGDGPWPELRPAKAVQGDIERLANFILKSDLGHPRCSEQKPNGESAVDAAIAIITELRNKNALTPESEGIAGKELRDWPEDFSHENGNYSCQCCQCNQMFVGHKRRAVCKLCALSTLAHPQEIDVKPTQNREKELMAVIADLSVDLIAERHGLGQRKNPTTAQIKHAAIIAEAQKGE